ncbi:hypothetical protein SISNIDRAFT_552436 [Sistotremastrum niveocremeum HHB9708]|uniref:FAD-binding domain-containing protein n=1 Tax=Sistotremastrum niveocremeum HHB9708 TaxID=1314777 RepID=A0A164PL98_9AGAM|nr:hypothetical protein SISNIDRAFT_552436 [Sistotremastrum niveocremeum HHB9708]
MAEQVEPAVLIVGAGPSGLVLALHLRLNNVPVRIIDKQPEFSIGSRATLIQPRTLEQFSLLGITREEIFESGVVAHQMRIYAPPAGTTAVKTFNFQEPLESRPSVPFTQPVTMSQDIFESILRSKLEALGTKVELGVELKSILNIGDEPPVAELHHIKENRTEMLKVPYLVGADGAKGVCRQLFSIPFLGETREADKMKIADVETDGITNEFWHMWGSFATAALDFFIFPSSIDLKHVSSVGLKPLGHGNKFQYQLVGPKVNHEALQTAEDLQNEFWEISGRKDITFKNVTWITTWRGNMRLAQSLQSGRRFLIGDAGHCHSPAGGQGMNTSILDAINLSWKLALVHNHHASPSLLDSYESERLPVIAEMLDLTTALHEKVWENKNGIDSKPPPLEATKEDSTDPMYRPKHFSQIGVNYRGSPIVFDERVSSSQESEGEGSGTSFYHSSTTLQAGDRAPDAELTFTPEIPSLKGPQTLFSFFTPHSHTILIFPGTSSLKSEKFVDFFSAIPWAIAQALVVLPKESEEEIPIISGCQFGKDVAGSAYADYGVGSGAWEHTAVVVRPDGIPGGFAKSVGGLKTYFEKLLGVDGYRMLMSL